VKEVVGGMKLFRLSPGRPLGSFSSFHRSTASAWCYGPADGLAMLVGPVHGSRLSAGSSLVDGQLAAFFAFFGRGGDSPCTTALRGGLLEMERLGDLAAILADHDHQESQSNTETWHAESEPAETAEEDECALHALGRCWSGPVVIRRISLVLANIDKATRMYRHLHRTHRV
jgi:hypothetical protein